MKFDWSLLATAFGKSWTFVSGLLGKVPYLNTFLSYASGPLGAVLGPIFTGVFSAIGSAVNFLTAYAKVFLDGLTVTAKNLSVLSVIFVTFVGGVYYGVKLDREYLPAQKPTVAFCKPVIDTLHQQYVFLPRKKK